MINELPDFYRDVTKVLAKLLLLFDHVGVLYMSVPIMTIFHTNVIVDSLVNQEREGGIIRILLKVIFICIKEEEKAYDILRYVIFRDRKSVV